MLKPKKEKVARRKPSGKDEALRKVKQAQAKPTSPGARAAPLPPTGVAAAEFLAEEAAFVKLHSAEGITAPKRQITVGG